MLLLVALFLVVAATEEPENLSDLPMQNPYLFEGDIIGVDGDLNDKNAVSNPRLKWPEAKIPYVIDESLRDHMDVINAAIQQYHQKTCIRFIPRGTEPHYVKMFAGQGCYSNVGKIGGEQKVSLGRGCYYVGTITHELGHAIGFYHEHNRSDRDDYLIIYWQNITFGMSPQFRKLNPEENILLTPFDYNSIMLYGETAFSKDRRSKTMVPKKPEFKLTNASVKPGLSNDDALRVNRLYGC